VLFPAARRSSPAHRPKTPNTGVEVIAQPRGKELSKMSLLSGGENRSQHSRFLRLPHAPARLHSR